MTNTIAPNSFRFVCMSFLILIPCLVRAQPNQEQAVPGLQIGFGRVDITPAFPTPMAGYYGKRLSTETHDPLWAKATVVDDGKTSVAMLTIDLIGTLTWFVDETRSLIAKQSNIRPECIMINATHSHTGPVLFDPNSSRYSRFGNEADESKQFMLELPKKLSECVLKANSNKQPMTVRHAVGEEHQLAFNRRFFMTDGTVGWNPGKRNPRIVREAGPTDDRLPMVAFMNKGGDLEGLLSNYSIHLDTVGGTQWSADMPYTLEQSLARVFGSKCHLQYSTGCCGDVNHIDVHHGFSQKGHAEAARIGTRLAGAVLRSWQSLEPVNGNRLHVTTEILKLPLAKHSADRVQWANSISERANNDKPPAFMEMVEAFRILDVEAKLGAPILAEVQVVSLGRNIAWIAMPGEIFVQLGIAIKDGSPFPTTVINELANGSIGYVPTRQAYSQGNYEVISARCAEGSGEMLVDSALHQLRKHIEFQNQQ